ncbi:hypothetical protein F2P56_000977 [Juglans regia]|uniref:Reverse transcriptase zinc-binding domain-containing protein n=1 Tax=Juglans regia TaxID=51240 RepID=A0A833XY96_JUGRE|nr:hypothetical protein F2P56_000977 [Juglans regia]
MVILGEQVQWNINFSRVAQDWEVGNFEDFLSLMYSIKPSNQRADVLWWLPTSKASLGKILTTDNLRKYKVIIMDWYNICKKVGEMVDHLFLHCEIAIVLWNEVFSRLEVAWVIPATVAALLTSWTNLRGIQQIKAVWKMVPICILWCLWQERNERTFEDKERTIEELRALFTRTLCTWAIAI